MTDHWEAAIHSHNDQSLTVTERSVVYLSSEGESVWDVQKFAYHPSVVDFLAESR